MLSSFVLFRASSVKKNQSPNILLRIQEVYANQMGALHVVFQLGLYGNAALQAKDKYTSCSINLTKGITLVCENAPSH